MKRLLSAALITVAMVILAACSSGSSSRAAEPSVDPDALRISANNLVFSTATLSAPADEPFQIAFDNQEGAPHNVAIYRDSSAAEKVFGEEPFSGRLSSFTTSRRWRLARTSSGATCIRK